MTADLTHVESLLSMVDGAAELVIEMQRRGLVKTPFRTGDPERLRPILELPQHEWPLWAVEQCPSSYAADLAAGHDSYDLGPDLEEVRASAERFARRYPFVESVYLFGSRAIREHRPDSDYDFLIVVSRDAPYVGSGHLPPAHLAWALVKDGVLREPPWHWVLEVMPPGTFQDVVMLQAADVPPEDDLVAAVEWLVRHKRAPVDGVRVYPPTLPGADR